MARLFFHTHIHIYTFIDKTLNFRCETPGLCSLGQVKRMNTLCARCSFTKARVELGTPKKNHLLLALPLRSKQITETSKLTFL